jgi:trigger factor
MKITAERVPEAQMVLEIEIDDEQLQQSLDQASKRLAQRVRIPGFRKGRAPRAVIERTLGPDALFDEAVEKLVGAAYDAAVEQEGIKPIGPPQFEIIEQDPVRFKATVPLEPVVDLGEYRSISSESQSTEITDEMVEESLLEVRRRHAVLEPVERPVQLNDRLKADIRAEVDGESVLNEIGAEFHVREGMVVGVPGVDEKLLGLEQGPEHEFTVDVDEDWDDEDVAGKSVKFFVTVHDVKEETLPDADDDLAAEVGEFESFEDLRSRIEGDLREMADRQATEALHEDVLHQTIDRATIEFPPMLIEHETEHVLTELAQRAGQSPQDFMAAQGSQAEAVLQSLRAQAHDRVISSLVLDEVARLEEIEITEEDVESEITKVAGDGPQAEQMRSFFESDNSRAMVRRNLLTTRTLERLAEIAVARGEANTDSDEDTATDSTKNDPSADSGDDASDNSANEQSAQPSTEPQASDTPSAASPE